MQIARDLAMTACGFLLIYSVAFCADTAYEQDNTWDKSLAFGINASRGNADSIFTTLSFDMARTREMDIARADIQASYGERNDETVAKEIMASSQYNRSVHERTFWTVSGSFEHNEIADIDYRYTIAPGYGYYFIKDDRRTLEVSGGIAYIGQKFQTGESDDYVSAHISERLEIKTGNAKIWNTLLFLPELADFGNFILKGELGLDAGLNSRWGLRMVLRNVYDSMPAKDRQNNDLMLISMLTLKL